MQSNETGTTKYDPFMENPIPTAIGLFILAFTMVLLNLVAIVVFKKANKTKPPVDYPLLSLLIANLLQGAVTLPSYALKKIDAWGVHQQAIICDIYRFSYFVCAHASILSLLASSIDRLIALIYSLRYMQIVTKKRISILLCAIWIVIIAFDIIPLFPIKRLDKDSCHYVPTKSWSVSMHVIMNIIPLPILIASYVVTIHIAFRHEKRAQLSKRLQSSKFGPKEKLTILYSMRATRKVLLIIGSYFICVGPACIYYLLEWLCKSCQTQSYKKNYEQYVHFTLKILVNFNAVVSAVIFFWNSKVFRKNARELFSTRDRFTDRKELKCVTDSPRVRASDTAKMLNNCDDNGNENKRSLRKEPFPKNLFNNVDRKNNKEQFLLRSMQQ